MLLQLDDLRPASSRLVEHSDPAHANPSAQVPAAWRDDRPAANIRKNSRRNYFGGGIFFGVFREGVLPGLLTSQLAEQLDCAGIVLGGERGHSTCSKDRDCAQELSELACGAGIEAAICAVG